jgi:hypothetical protein
MSEPSARPPADEPRPSARKAHAVAPGRWKVAFGALYVLGWLLLPRLLFWLFLPPGAETPAAQAAAELRTARARQEELLALKDRGAPVGGTATVDVERQHGEDGQPDRIKEVTRYTYPGGKGSLTAVTTAPAGLSPKEADRAMAELWRQKSRQDREYAVRVIRLRDDPGVNVLADNLEGELKSYRERVARLEGEEARLNREAFRTMVWLTSPGWAVGLFGLLQMAAAFWRRRMGREPAGA